MHDPVRTVDRQIWRDGGVSEGTRTIPEETALALTYNGGTYAVMMGTPRDLAGFCHRLQPQRRHHPVARRHRYAGHRRSRRRYRIADVAGAIQSRPAERATAPYRGPDRLRPLWHRLDRGSDPSGRDRGAAAVVLAERHHDGDAKRCAVAADQHRDPRGPCRGVLDAGARHRRASRRRRPPQRARQAGRRGSPGEGRRRRRHGVADQPGLGRNGAEGSGDGRAPDGRGLCAYGARGPHGGCRRHHARRDRTRRRF